MKRATQLRRAEPLIIASVVLVCAMCLVACFSRPEKNLLGKWQSKPIPDGVTRTKQIAFEFLEDGTLVYSRKWQTSRGAAEGHWEQVATGTFTLINTTRLKMDWRWDVGQTAVYEIKWWDRDHIRLKSGDGGMTEFERVN